MHNSSDGTGFDTDRAWKLLIGGEWVDPAAGTYPVIDPNDGTVVGHAPEATAVQAADAARAARDALGGWRALSPAERGGHLARLADVIERMAPSWLDLVQAETGSVTSIAKSLQVGGPMIERFRYYSNPINVDTDIAPMPADKGALGPAGLIAATVKRQPVGVVACITPYNMPLVNVAGKVAPALAAGNTVVIKPAPQDPLGVLLLGEAVTEAGFADGVVNIVTGSGPEAPAALVASTEVNMVSFTGSTQVGARIYADGASTMKRVLMELGGKGALVMTEDADVNAACMGIATTWGLHSGQICTAPTRVVCHRSILDQTVETLKAFAGFMKVGDGRAPDTIVGPVITEAHRDRVESFIAGGLDAGATAVCGGQRPDLPGYFVEPTLLVDVTPGMQVVRDEAFGPVVVVLAHNGDDEAVALANDSPYGLFSYVYAGDAKRAYEIGCRLESGNVALNTVQPHMYAPFGGFKMSGIGRDRGKWGIEAYTEIQAINWLS
ncbi:MAG: aldehyde dehydrogenase family protein [Acidimicrobiaceae bacterium]|nr:aldehyde dehydrogenase family protein [Acidimicrobiaceae bacterium]